jgi:hypothetical protein
MDDTPAPGPTWRQEVDVEGVKLALMELRSLLQAVAATGSSMLIKMDGERRESANPPIFTVVISGIADDADPIRFDDSDLIRAVVRAISAFDARHRQQTS